MKCTLCKNEMTKLQKGKPMKITGMGSNSNVESIEYDIDYTKAKDTVDKILNSNGNKLYITPETYFCPHCGLVSQKLNESDLDIVKKLEGV